MKLLSFKKCRMDNQIYVSQLSVSLFFYELLFKVKKIDLRLKKILKLKFKLIFFNSVYPTRLCDTMPKYTIYLPILLVERLFKWSWVLSCCFILWLAKLASKLPCILLCEIEILFFYPILPTPRFKQLLFGISNEKFPKIWKRTSFGVFFSVCKSHDRAINRQRII